MKTKNSKANPQAQMAVRCSALKVSYHTIMEKNSPATSAATPKLIRSFFLIGQSCLAKALTISVSTPNRKMRIPIPENTTDEDQNGEAENDVVSPRLDETSRPKKERCKR